MCFFGRLKQGRVPPQKISPRFENWGHAFKMRENNDTVIKPWKNIWKHREKAVKNPRDKCRKITHVTRQKFLWVPPPAGLMVGKLGIYSVRVFFSHVSPLFKRTVLVLWSDWAGLISIFESPIFRHTQENHLFCCFYPYFCWLSPPFFCCWNHGLQRPRLGNAAPGLPMFGIRQAASAQHQHRRRCRIRGETARGALRQKKRAPCRCGKCYGKLKQYWIVIYIYANKV